MLLSRVRYTALAGLALAVLWLALSPDAMAQGTDKKTVMTIDQPFQIPGVTLPAGKYVVKLVDLTGSRSIVRFMSSDEKKIYATLLGVPDYRLAIPDKNAFSFYESKSGDPRPLRAWFFRGENWGVEFVYPKAKAVEIAKASGEHVVATSAEPPASSEAGNLTESQANSAAKELAQEPVFGIQPSGNEVELSAIHSGAPTAVALADVQTPAKLPKTATPFALFGLAGLLAAGAAAAVRVSRKRV